MKQAALAERPGRRGISRGTVVGAILLAVAAWAVAYVWAQQRDPAYEHIRAGRDYIRMNDFPAAEQEWKEAARLNPDSAAAWELLAEYYSRRHDYRAAVEPLRNLARLRPEASYILDRLAFSASQTGDAGSVLRDAEAALKQNPNDVGELAIAAEALTTLDDERKRLAYLRRIVQLRPNNTDYLVLLARTLTNAHFYDEAAPLIDRILQRDPKSADGYGLRARKELDTAASPADLARAEADFYKVLALNPHGPMPHLHLGKLYLRTGQADRAIAQLEMAARALPNQPEVFYVLATAYGGNNQPARAAAARQRFAALRRRQDRLDVLQKRCIANPDSFADHLELGLIALDMGDLDRADYFLRRARSLRPGDSRASAALQKLAAAESDGQTGDPGGRQ